MNGATEIEFRIANNMLGSLQASGLGIGTTAPAFKLCLLYTSDAADDLLCVDLGGRRIIKTKPQVELSKDTH